MLFFAWITLSASYPNIDWLLIAERTRLNRRCPIALRINPFIPFLFVLSKERNILVARACYFISDDRKHIGLVRNFFAFFSKILFLFSNIKNTTSFQQCMLHYYLWLLAKEVEEVHFEIVLVVEFFLAQMIRQRTVEVVVRRSQVWRIRSM
jgi:hypothetical protein